MVTVFGFAVFGMGSLASNQSLYLSTLCGSSSDFFPGTKGSSVGFPLVSSGSTSTSSSLTILPSSLLFSSPCFASFSDPTSSASLLLCSTFGFSCSFVGLCLAKNQLYISHIPLFLRCVSYFFKSLYKLIHINVTNNTHQVMIT